MFFKRSWPSDMIRTTDALFRSLDAGTCLAFVPAKTIHWIFRIAVTAEFIGHGAFGIITKAAWVPYFAVAGISEAWAWALMPVIGVMDITLGVLTLFRPMRAVLLYMAFWGFQTACLRPLAGEDIWECLERAGNFGVPFAFLVLAGWGRSRTDWFTHIKTPAVTPARVATLAWILRLTTGMLLIGHGGIGAVMAQDWTAYFAAVGIGAATIETRALTPGVGWFEIALGLLVIARPSAVLLVFVFVWKVSTEWLRPMAGEPLWEFIERFGSFAAPLALLFLSRWSTCFEAWRHRRGGVVSRGLEKENEADLN
jgi:hypothetical protein